MKDATHYNHSGKHPLSALLSYNYVESKTLAGEEILELDDKINSFKVVAKFKDEDEMLIADDKMSKTQ